MNSKLPSPLLEKNKEQISKQAEKPAAARRSYSQFVINPVRLSSRWPARRGQTKPQRRPRTEILREALPQLRPYQATAVDIAYLRLTTPNIEPLRAYISLATGGGKTAIAAVLAARYLGSDRLAPTFPRCVLFVVHRRELARQQVRELERWSGLKVSLLMAGEVFDPSASIIVASQQTLDSRFPEELRARRPVVMFDECHHASIGSMADRLLQWLGNVSAVGFSATPLLSWEKSRPVLTECLFERGMSDLIAEGVLCRLVSERIEAPMELARIASQNDDYSGLALAAEAEKRAVVAIIVQAAAPRIRERPGPALAFGCSVKHVHLLADAFAAAGVSVGRVWGEQPEGERAAAFSAWRAGQTQLLVNCGIVAEGIDLPSLLTIVIARPSRSRRLYQQIVGHGTRLSPGKTECLILEACAVRPDPKQVMLGAIVPEAQAHGGGPAKLWLLDPEAAGRWVWRAHRHGVFSATADADLRVYLVEDSVTGLMGAVAHRRGGSFQTLITGLPQVEAMRFAGRWMAQNASLAFAAASWWRKEDATQAQIDLLQRNGVDALNLSRGEASELIEDIFAERTVPHAIRWLAK